MQYATTAALCLVASVPGLLASPTVRDTSVVPRDINVQYDFSNNDTLGKYFKNYGGLWYADGKLHGGDDPGKGAQGNRLILNGPDKLRDYYYSTKILIPSASASPDVEPYNAGIVFQVSGNGVGLDNYLGFYLGLNPRHQAVVFGYADTDGASGKWTALQSTGPTGLLADQEYTYEIYSKGNNIVAYVAGVLYVNHTIKKDEPFAPGEVGYRTFGCQLQADDLLVKDNPK